MVAGVCAGIAQHFNIDPVWVRLGAVFLTLLNGIGLLLYLAAWMIMPLDTNVPAASAA
jgi:phage shock protein C